MAATGAVTAGLAAGSITASGNEQSQDTQTDVAAMPQPPVNAPQIAIANASDTAVVKAKAKAAKKAAQKAAAQAAADAAAAAAQQAAQQQQQQQQSASKSHGS